ncbi:MAG: sugar ABC transporter permease [Treponema sp.]|jgi:raffinose/stachyose/melibiose transport system permease protein|nr:sugar ABC transporter permease [Treponema sp.]
MRQGRNSNYQIIAAVLFILPTAIFVLGFSYYPAFRAIIGSFTRWDGFNEPSFVGLSNYKALFTDRIFHISIRNVSGWSIGSLLVSLIVPFIGAELIFHLRSNRAQYLYRVLFIIPLVVPATVTILIWTFIYEPSIGLLNSLLTDVFRINREIIPNWLGDSRFVIPSLIFIGFPWLAGLNLLVYYSGLQDISGDVIEYAQLDGCTGVSRVLKIDIPLIMGQIRLLLILGIIGTLQNVTTPLLMTNGGPGYDSYVPGLYMYFKAFRLSDFGSAYTIATVMFIMIFTLTLISRRINLGGGK